MECIAFQDVCLATNIDYSPRCSLSTMAILRRSVVAFSLAAASLANTIQPLVSTAAGAFSFQLSNLTYYSPAAAIAEGVIGNVTYTEPGLLPMTVLETNETTITADVLSSLVNSYTSLDDVWTEDFLQGVLVVSGPSDASLDASAASWLESAGIEQLLTSAGVDTSSFVSGSIAKSELLASWDLQPGPYTISSNATGATVRQVYAMHRDKYEAFLFGVTPVPGSSAYESVELFVPSYQDTWVPVPSRLYWLNDDRPLAGLRIGLKDIYDLEGVQTGGGSRSYAEIYPVSNTTAVSIHKLLDLGAVIIVSRAFRNVARDPY